MPQQEIMPAGEPGPVVHPGGVYQVHNGGRLDGWELSEQATGPLAGWFQGMAGNGSVDGLVMAGEVLIGTALADTVMMFFYGAKPPAISTFINQRAIYMVALNLLAPGTAHTHTFRPTRRGACGRRPAPGW